MRLNENNTFIGINPVSYTHLPASRPEQLAVLARTYISNTIPHNPMGFHSWGRYISDSCSHTCLLYTSHHNQENTQQKEHHPPVSSAVAVGIPRTSGVAEPVPVAGRSN